MRRLALLVALFAAVMVSPALAQPNVIGTPALHDFGQVSVGDAVATSIDVINLGTEPVAVEDVRTVGSTAFSILGGAGAVLDPGETVEVQVEYAPTSPGFHEAILEIAVGGLVFPLTELYGQGTALDVSPGMYDFGRVAVGGSATTTITVTNRAQDALSITGMSFVGGDADSFNVLGLTPPHALDSGDAFEFQVEYAPTLGGTHEAVLQITSDIPEGGVSQVELLGEALVALAVSPNTYDFGTLRVGVSATTTVLVTNMLDDALSITGVIFDGIDGDNFNVVDPSLPSSVGPHEAAAFAVEYAPTSVGTHDTVLHFSTNLGPDASTESVFLSGTAESPTIGWANTEFPPSMTHTISAVNRTPNIYGQVWIDGLTNEPGPAPGIVAQVGYGPDGASPSDPSWQWTDADFNVDIGNNDEYVGSLLPDTLGVFDYLYRYSTDDGDTWLYADLDGPGTGDPGQLTVLPSPDTTPPASVTLSEVSRSFSEIGIAWAASPDVDLAGYEVLRRPAGSSDPFGKIAELGTGSLAYSDGTVSAGSTYEYVVRAFDTSYNRSPDSNTVTITATPLTPTEAVEELVALVEALNLHNGISNSLDAKLQNAAKALEDLNENNNAAAIGKLEAFINEVQAQSGNKIAVEDANALIARARPIIELLTN